MANQILWQTRAKGEKETDETISLVLRTSGEALLSVNTWWMYHHDAYRGATGRYTIKQGGKDPQQKHAEGWWCSSHIQCTKLFPKSAFPAINTCSFYAQHLTKFLDSCASSNQALGQIAGNPRWNKPFSLQTIVTV